MPLILPGNVATATASTTYDVANSCRFDDGDSAGMHKAMGTPSDQDKWTFSCWFKRGNVITGATAYLLSTYVDGSNDSAIRIESNDKLSFYNYTSSSYAGRQRTNRLFRDPAAWYHLVCTYDSGNATAAHRMRMYINGVEETVFDVETNPAEDEDSHINTASTTISLAAQWNGSAMGEEYDGYMAEVYFCDGQAYAASDFGEFDSDSPSMWKAKDASGLTFGTNGFYLDFEASGNLGNDANGGTDLTEVNVDAVDQCTDSPSNNFCVINPLDNFHFQSTYSEGNCKIVTGGSGRETFTTGTMPLTKGKWYYEMKISTASNGDYAGWTSHVSNNYNDKLEDNSDKKSIAYRGAAGTFVVNAGVTSDGVDTYTDGDVIGLYIDLDNLEAYCSKNGTVQNSATGITITAAASNGSGYYLPGLGDEESNSLTAEVNFGNPVSALSSAVADANGYGQFEYSPSGTFDSVSKDFLAICTKNLGSDGG
jgi:hypothetical protein